LAIRFEDRSPIASVLKNELQDTILNVVRSYRAGVEEKENKQSKEELAIASNNFDYIQRKIGSLKPGVSTQTDVDNISNGIATLKNSHLDNKVFQSSVNLLELELSSASNRLNKRNTTATELDSLLDLAENKIKDPYQTSSEDELGINALMKDIQKNYDSKYNHLSAQDQTFYNKKINEALGYLGVAQKMSQLDVKDSPGLQLNKELTKLGFKNGQLTDTDAFQSNKYQSTVKAAADFFQEGDYVNANKLYLKANELEITEGTRAKDINDLFSLYYDDKGKVRKKYGEDTKFWNPNTGEMEIRSMTDLLSTAVGLAKQGQLEESEKYLNMIPQDLEAMKDQNIEIQEQYISDQYDEFDNTTKLLVNDLDAVQFKSISLNPMIAGIGDKETPEVIGLTTAFNKMNTIKLVRSKSGAVSSEQIEQARNVTSEAISTLVTSLDQGNLSDKLQELIEGYKNTKPESKPRQLAAHKIAMYLGNNPTEVSTFDLLVWKRGLQHPQGAGIDNTIREEIGKMFTKYGYYNDLYSNLTEKDAYTKYLKDNYKNFKSNESIFDNSETIEDY
tara:strand:- start:22012 stop:23694 length:1683 start_codon:yes stop_codon:yes gene_type:complete